MSRRTQLKGLGEIERNMNKALAHIKSRTNKGLVEAARFLHDYMQSTGIKIPKDSGDLEKSWYIVDSDGVIRTRVPSFVGPDSTRVTIDYGRAVSAAQGYASIPSLGLYVIMGFAANYATRVHELLDSGVKWTRPGSGPKWFQGAIGANKRRILIIVAQQARIDRRTV